MYEQLRERFIVTCKIRWLLQIYRVTAKHKTLEIYSWNAKHTIEYLNILRFN